MSKKNKQKRGEHAMAFMDAPKPQLPPTPVRPEVMRALQDALCDYRLDKPLIEAPDLDGLTKPITYVIDGKGLWEIRQTPFGVACRKADALRGSVDVMQEGFVFALPKVPWGLYAQIVQWFRHVHQQWKAEAYAQLWYSPEALQHMVPANAERHPVVGGTYYVHVPVQDISGGKVEHVGAHDEHGETGGHLHVLDIHSHHTMGAFWSGTDDSDERKHERLFAVVGTIHNIIPSSRWRTCISGKFIDLTLGEVVEVPDHQHNFHINFGALIRNGGEVNLSKIAVDPFEGVTFPATWNAPLITERPVHVAGYLRSAQEYYTNHHHQGFGYTLGDDDELGSILPTLPNLRRILTVDPALGICEVYYQAGERRLRPIPQAEIDALTVRRKGHHHGNN